MQSGWMRGAGVLALASTLVAALPVLAGPGERSAAALEVEVVTGEPRGAVADHVIVISIDGLRPDAIGRYNAKVLQRLVSEGASSLEARTIHPSKTLPSHTSMLTGVTPEVHGITWNSDRTGETGTVEVATVFELAKAMGFETAAFFGKNKLQHLLKPGTVDHAEGPRYGLEMRMATETVEAATRHLKHRRPHLAFIHLGEPDFAGHTVGWMTFAYGWAVRRADAAVGRILEAADAAFGAGNYTVIVTADHGGHGRDHGSAADADMQIPWIAWGAGVERGPITAAVNTTDTAATVLWLLGVGLPAEWTGRPVATAYTHSARYAAQSAAAASGSVLLP